MPSGVEWEELGKEDKEEEEDGELCFGTKFYIGCLIGFAEKGWKNNYMASKKIRRFKIDCWGWMFLILYMGCTKDTSKSAGGIKTHKMNNIYYFF